MDISISLTPELLDLINGKVASGRYSSTSEVVREALRLLEEAERQETEQIEDLRLAWREGIESGDAGPLDFTALRRDAERERTAKQKG